MSLPSPFLRGPHNARDVRVVLGPLVRSDPRSLNRAELRVDVRADHVIAVLAALDFDLLRIRGHGDGPVQTYGHVGVGLGRQGLVQQFWSEISESQRPLLVDIFIVGED